jgi:hypothetical protein
MRKKIQKEEKKIKKLRKNSVRLISFSVLIKETLASLTAWMIATSESEQDEEKYKGEGGREGRREEGMERNEERQREGGGRGRRE